MKRISKPEITYAHSVMYLALKKEAGLTVAEIAKHHGVSKNYVDNILRCARNLIDPIIRAWKEPAHRDHHLCSTNRLNRLAALSPGEQERQWESICRGEQPKTQFDDAMRRPSTYHQLPMSRQWGIDKELGILDWDGAMSKEQLNQYFQTHPKREQNEQPKRAREGRNRNGEGKK